MYSNLSLDQQHYYGCISAMDEQVGRLRKHLRNLGIEENTVLFFTSDNGPEGKRIEDQAALVGKQFKIYSKDDGKSFTLYDLVKDPAETVGQEDLHPELFSTLEEKWNNWKVSQEYSADGNDYLEH